MLTLSMLIAGTQKKSSLSSASTPLGATLSSSSSDVSWDVSWPPDGLPYFALSPLAPRKLGLFLPFEEDACCLCEARLSGLYAYLSPGF